MDRKLFKLSAGCVLHACFSRTPDAEEAGSLVQNKSEIINNNAF